MAYEQETGGGTRQSSGEQARFSDGAHAHSSRHDNGGTGIYVVLIYEKRKGIQIMKKGLLNVRSKKGMELVQVAILIGIAVAVGLIFRTQITDFVNAVFSTLAGGGFTS